MYYTDELYRVNRKKFRECNVIEIKREVKRMEKNRPIKQSFAKRKAVYFCSVVTKTSSKVPNVTGYPVHLAQERATLL